MKFAICGVGHQVGGIAQEGDKAPVVTYRWSIRERARRCSTGKVYAHDSALASLAIPNTHIRKVLQIVGPIRGEGHVAAIRRNHHSLLLVIPTWGRQERLL